MKAITNVHLFHFRTKRTNVCMLPHAQLSSVLQPVQARFGTRAPRRCCCYIILDLITKVDFQPDCLADQPVAGPRQPTSNPKTHEVHTSDASVPAQTHAPTYQPLMTSALLPSIHTVFNPFLPFPLVLQIILSRLQAKPEWLHLSRPCRQVQLLKPFPSFPTIRSSRAPQNRGHDALGHQAHAPSIPPPLPPNCLGSDTANSNASKVRPPTTGCRGSISSSSSNHGLDPRQAISAPSTGAGPTPEAVVTAAAAAAPPGPAAVTPAPTKPASLLQPHHAAPLNSLHTPGSGTCLQGGALPTPGPCLQSSSIGTPSRHPQSGALHTPGQCPQISAQCTPGLQKHHTPELRQRQQANTSQPQQHTPRLQVQQQRQQEHTPQLQQQQRQRHSRQSLPTPALSLSPFPGELPATIWNQVLLCSHGMPSSLLF
mmetsp:Transcript_26077/g.67225  ORF Transcript_26077/g.67225 Transcript_26077/m.67225 type:complete len:427 (-) Transcript_26077:889-2169(-)